MAWNESGGGNPGGKRNPWGGGNKPDQGPPDLDEVFRNLRRRFGGLFGGANGPSTGTSGPGRGISISRPMATVRMSWGVVVSKGQKYRFQP